MVQNQIRQHLDRLARRLKAARWWTALAIAGLILAGLSWGMLSMEQMTADGHRVAVFVLSCSACLGAIAACAARWSVRRDYRGLAQRVETKFPELDSRLLAAVQIDASDRGAKIGYLEQAVIHQTLLHGMRHAWESIVSARWLWGTRFASVATWFLFIALTYLVWTREDFVVAEADKVPLPMVAAAATTLVNVDPGDIEVERGSSLIVMVEYAGTLPLGATLVVADKEGEERRLPMSGSNLDDPVFAARIAAVKDDLTYRVELDDLVSDTYAITAFDLPRLDRADITINSPAYANRPPKLVADTRRVSALQGSEIGLRLYLNKAVESAILVRDLDYRRNEKTGDLPAQVKLELASTLERRYETSFPLELDQRYQLVLRDDKGRLNRDTPFFTFSALSNQAPQLKVITPARDVTVSALEELMLEASVQDDIGLIRFGLDYMHEDQTHSLELSDPTGQLVESSDPSLSNSLQETISHLMCMEDLPAEPNQSISYYFWAEDYDSEGNPRRVFSDMFFIDVRPFDEIFREGQEQPGNDSQSNSQSGQQGDQQGAPSELIEIQKFIINGTWNIVRRETGARVGDSFVEDVDVLRQAQSDAAGQAAEIVDQITDENLRSVAERVALEMKKAEERLGRAMLDRDARILREAIMPEQIAFQNLVKLRPDEFEVSRQRNQSQNARSQSSSSSRMQQQLQQLELSNSENRYEEQSTPEDEEDAAARENRQVLNRLRELAQRQEDLTQQLQELQTALQNAETEEERDAIERQLQRLREEQEEILRETDELAERTAQNQDQQVMRDAQEQLEEARENVRQASEALEQNQVSQAAAAGARAASQFEDLREEFQRQTSNALQEQMNEMRRQANEIREREERIGESLAERNAPERRSLRDEPVDELLNDLQTQRDELQLLLEKIKQMVGEAESSEPLLANELYDAYRDADQQNIDQVLEQTRMLLDQGFVDEAGQLEQLASSAIESLADRVNEAAESIVGDQTEALQRAEATLEELQKEIEGELESLAPQSSQNQGQGDSIPEDSDRDVRPPGTREQPNQQSPSTDQQQSRGESGQQNPTGEQRTGASSQERGQPQDRDQPPGERGQSGQQQTGQGDQEGERQRESQSNEPSAQENQDRSGNPASRPRNAQPGRVSAGDYQEQGQPNLSRMFEEAARNRRPLTGDDYRDWSDRMRDVEELIDDSELRDEATRIREQVREFRSEFRRHSITPSFDMVNEMVAVPLEQLRRRVNEELLRRQSRDALVPIDRDPVPEEFTDDVSEYYERIGSGQ